jgi:hypothetical protein
MKRTKEAGTSGLLIRVNRLLFKATRCLSSDGVCRATDGRLISDFDRDRAEHRAAAANQIFAELERHCLKGVARGTAILAGNMIWASRMTL